jgi:DNA polymerase-4/DNA polymerase V
MPKLQPGTWVLHVDGDAFFASCEVARRPDLRGKPVVIGQERGIATAFTYEAKAIGIKRGDPIFKIRKEYPNVTILSSHFDIYTKYNKALRELLSPYVEFLENYSIDECFAIIRSSEEDLVSKIQNLKKLIQSKLGITYSFGISINKTLAKVGSKLNKPDGITFLTNKDTIGKVLSETPVENIWGIGRATVRELSNMDIRTAGDFVKSDFITLSTRGLAQPVFETRAELMTQYVFEVAKSNPHQKSLQSTRMFVRNTVDYKIIFSELSRHLEIICRQLQKSDLYAQHLQVLLKYKDKLGRRYYKAESIELQTLTNTYLDIIDTVERTFGILIKSQKQGILYTGSGIHVQGLIHRHEVRQDLFGEYESVLSTNSIDTHIQSIRSKFGFASITSAASLNSIKLRSADYIKRHKDDKYEQDLPFIYLGTVS